VKEKNVNKSTKMNKIIIFGFIVSILILSGCQKAPSEKEWQKTLLYYGSEQPDGKILPETDRCAEDCAKKCMELNMKYDYHELLSVRDMRYGENEIINYNCECYCLV